MFRSFSHKTAHAPRRTRVCACRGGEGAREGARGASKGRGGDASEQGAAGMWRLRVRCLCWCAAQARECGACGCGVCANVCCGTAVPCCRAAVLAPASSPHHRASTRRTTVPLPAVIPEKRVFVVLSPAIFHVVGFWGRNSKLMQVGSRSSPYF